MNAVMTTMSFLRDVEGLGITVMQCVLPMRTMWQLQRLIVTVLRPGALAGLTVLVATTAEFPPSPSSPALLVPLITVPVMQVAWQWWCEDVGAVRRPCDVYPHTILCVSALSGLLRDGAPSSASRIPSRVNDLTIILLVAVRLAGVRCRCHVQTCTTDVLCLLSLSGVCAVQMYYGRVFLHDLLCLIGATHGLCAGAMLLLS